MTAAIGTDATAAAAKTSTAIIRRRRSVRSVQAPIASPNRRCGTVKIAAAPPSATADPVSLKTMSGIANCVIDVPNAETVSPVQNFQKSSFRSETYRRTAASSLQARQQSASVKAPRVLSRERGPSALQPPLPAAAALCSSPLFTGGAGPLG